MFKTFVSLLSGHASYVTYRVIYRVLLCMTVFRCEHKHMCMHISHNTTELRRRSQALHKNYHLT